jgi:cobalt-zinc-cadmium efflux system membrane fusion protein
VVELSPAQIKTAGITLGKIEDRQISGTIRANGILDVPPQQLVSVSAPMGGFLKSTDLLEGSRVKKGEMVATIENLEFIQMQQDYLEAKSNFEFAEADYKRQQALAKENVNSEKTLHQSKTSYTTWLARYNGLLEKLKLLNLNPASIEQGNLKGSINLYSPINGYVTQVNVNIGKFVNSADVLFEIVDTEHLHAELIVFERDVPKLKIGQKVRFTLANESKDRMATIYLIGREIGDDRTIQIHCHIDQEDKELLPGMYLNAVVETGGALVPSLPDEAIMDFRGEKHLFVITDAHAEDEKNPKGEGKAGEGGTSYEMVKIQTGNSELGYTEIILPPDFDRTREIVIKGAYALLSELKNSEEEEGHAH